MLIQGVSGVWHRLKSGIGAIGGRVYRALRWVANRAAEAWRRPGFRRWTYRIAGSIAAFAVLTVGLYAALFSWLDSRTPPADRPDQTVWLDQGWSLEDRATYYYTPQGAYLKRVRYDWFQHLERPWSRDRFADPKYLRSYGFQVDADAPARDPGLIPVVGLTKRYDAEAGEAFVDITCAACHNGELQVMKDGQRVAVRIDGGQAMHDVTSSRLGGFGLDLLASLTATYLDPFKFDRFARNVLASNDTAAARRVLRARLWDVVRTIGRQAAVDGTRKLYAHEEGFGRTDAIARISNNVFATHLDPKNYREGNAPVSYPPVWDIWKFDWVQYTGSVSQPMARNVGESLGSGADYYLLDPYGRPMASDERYNASVIVPNLKKIETVLQKLRPPAWPEQHFGPIDRTLAEEGRQLFLQHCQTCHGPHAADAALTRLQAPMKGPEQPLWVMTLLAADDIGTDPQAALNFFRVRLDLTRTQLTGEEVRERMRPTYEALFTRKVAYLQERLGAAGSPSCSALAMRLKQELDALQAQGARGFANAQLNQIDLRSVAIGQGLNYLVTMIRQEAYDDLGLAPDSAQRAELDGFAQLDTPQVVFKYKARPLAGVWATAPFLHNGSVPTLYHMLVPAHLRPKKFYVRSKMFDPKHVGLVTDANEPGAFLFDATVVGNQNGGHEFRAGYVPWKPGSPPANGVIGPELSERQRWAIVEYLKIHRDEDTTTAYRDPNACVAVPEGASR